MTAFFTAAAEIAHRGIWVEPELMAEIEYRATSAEGKVRHPFFKGPTGGRWAEKPLDSPLSIPADIHHAVMSLPPAERRDRST